jgi:H+/Cl- antiporter ClcA
VDSSVSLKIGTITGTLLGVVSNIFSEDIAKTIVLAIIGAVSSFAVTLLLKWISKPKKK